MLGDPYPKGPSTQLRKTMITIPYNMETIYTLLVGTWTLRVRADWAIRDPLRTIVAY